MTSNRFGLSKKDYIGLKSTLCTGCGHDLITNHLITALFEAEIEPWNVAKLSGIGCSAKTTAYFLNQAHGINFIHGRMAPLAAGVHMSNPELTLIGISGDGDSMSIGLSGLAHLIRKNIPMVYIVENNGVYGLTKGQFSATADEGSVSKSGGLNSLAAIDVCQFALGLKASFVARAFSGDKKQMVPLLKAALKHNGTAIIDIVSPCVTFNNHVGSSKSFDFVKTHQQLLHDIGYVGSQEPIEVDTEETTTIELHDGSHLTLKQIDKRKHDVTDHKAALDLAYESTEGELVTGLFYLNEQKTAPVEALNLSKEPRHKMSKSDLGLSAQQLEEIQSDFC